ncbi:MAG: OpgC domain-containing protein [Dehalococcoidia bacterium]
MALPPLTGGNRFFFGAAEAFVFISGLVMGMVYAGVIARQGLGAAITKTLRRAWTLYTLTVLLTLTFPALSVLLGLPWAPRVTPSEIPAYVVGVLTLHRTFFLADVLMMYTFLVLGAVPVLALLARGRTAAALAGSWGLWAVWQIWPEQAQVPWPIIDNTLFNIPAWQALFMTALVLGYHRRALERRFAGISWSVTLAASAAFALVSALAFFGLPAALRPLTEDPTVASALIFDKAQVRIGRMVVFAGLFVFAYALLTLAWTPIRRTVGWFLLPLGHHALAAYALHIYLVGIFTWALHGVHGLAPRSRRP